MCEDISRFINSETDSTLKFDYESELFKRCIYWYIYEAEIVTCFF